MTAMPMTHDLVQEAKTIVFHQESHLVQGVGCLHGWKGWRAETRAKPRAL